MGHRGPGCVIVESQPPHILTECLGQRRSSDRPYSGLRGAHAGSTPVPGSCRNPRLPPGLQERAATGGAASSSSSIDPGVQFIGQAPKTTSTCRHSPSSRGANPPGNSPHSSTTPAVLHHPHSFTIDINLRFHVQTTPDVLPHHQLSPEHPRVRKWQRE